MKLHSFYLVPGKGLQTKVIRQRLLENALLRVLITNHHAPGGREKTKTKKVLMSSI